MPGMKVIRRNLINGNSKPHVYKIADEVLVFSSSLIIKFSACRKVLVSNSETSQTCQPINTNRVLLKKAREGMIIYIPYGSEEDETRKPSYYDLTYQYLKECGVRDLL